MARQPEHEDAATDRKDEGDKASAPKAARLKTWASKGGQYIAEGFAPVVSLVALVTAVIAVTGNQAAQTQLKEGLAKVNGMNAGLLTIRGDLEKLKMTLAQEKSLQDGERKKLDDSLAKIIQGLTRVQVKLKVSPTVEEQLHLPDGTSAVTPAPVSAKDPVGAKAHLPVVAASPEKKRNPQVKAMMDAIKDYNKQ
jgi:hypothetical protein